MRGSEEEVRREMNLLRNIFDHNSMKFLADVNIISDPKWVFCTT